ncbi:hypothetical protein ACOTJF_28310 [Achromobacter ruhlandii]|uniref:hypothetical protein n=1 Tax=Achromobacter ruhlandii TaxID=72557 RepID=UPI003BA3D0B5
MRKEFNTMGGNFEACREAEQWCRDRDIAVGRMEHAQPRGLAVGNYAIAKWSNLRPHERSTLDGRMTGDMRHGPVVVELNGDEADYPVIPEEYREVV